MPQRQVFVPYSGAVDRGGQDPAAAAAILLRDAMGAGFDPVKLRSLREGRQTELRDQLGADLATGDVRDGRNRQYQLQQLGGDLADDPFTGEAEDARVGGIESALDRAATTNRSEIGDASNTIANRNAFAKFMMDKAGYGAQTSPEGQAALDAASRRKVNEVGAAYSGRLGLQGNKPINVSVRGKQQLDALNKLEVIAPRILSGLSEKYPGIDEDSTKYGGVVDAGKAQLAKLGYLFGVDNRDDDIKQLEQLLKAIGVNPYMGGMRNLNVYKDISAHTGDMGFSPGADYSRIKTLADPDLIRELRDSIMQSEMPIDPHTGQQRVPGAAPGGGRGGGLPAGVTVTPRR